MSVLRGRPPGFAAGINGARRSHSPSLRSLGRRSPSLAIRAPVSLRPHPELSLKTADDPVNHPFLNGILPFETGSKLRVKAALSARASHYLIGGAYCRPPLFHNAFKPRRILIGEPMPTLRSNDLAVIADVP